MAKIVHNLATLRFLCCRRAQMSLSLNPTPHRHFEDDLNPGVYKESGFRMLDRIVNRCAAENLYVVLDLHAVPGGQNQDWHSDSGVHKAMFWQFKEFQDRMINLWMEIARRYKGNAYVRSFQYSAGDNATLTIHTGCGLQPT